jgi:hypothetical protein
MLLEFCWAKGDLSTRSLFSPTIVNEWLQCSINKNWISVLFWCSYRDIDGGSSLLGYVFSLDHELCNNAPSKGLPIFASRTKSWSECIKLWPDSVFLFGPNFPPSKDQMKNTVLTYPLYMCILTRWISDSVSQTIVLEQLLIRRLIL